MSGDDVFAPLEEWLDSESEPIALLAGGAGTGKTTLVREVVAWAKRNNRSIRLLAPTGRAARILATRVGMSAQTIHSAQYRIESITVREPEGPDDRMIRYDCPIREEACAERLVIVDEASLVGDVKLHNEVFQFGSGRLLTDLLLWTRCGERGGAKILFVGDPAQLPPVGQQTSPALDGPGLRSRGLVVREHTLTMVWRQSEESEVLARATDLRGQILSGVAERFDLSPGVEIQALDGPAAIESVVNDPEGTILIASSNASVRDHNRAIRSRRWNDDSTEPRAGDRLLVVRNSAEHGLMNGDQVEIVKIGPSTRDIVPLKGQEPQELVFREVALRGEEVRVEALILENLLHSAEREIGPRLSQALLVDFERRVPFPRNSPEYRQALRSDARLNALYVRYGYAMTCHKAQGGEWPQVVVDFAGMTQNVEGLRWAYTAITRTRKDLGTLGAPRFSPYVGLASSMPEEDATGETQLRQRLEASGVRVMRCNPVQDGVKLVLRRNDTQCVVRVYKNGKGRVTSVLPERGDNAIFRDAQAALLLEETKPVDEPIARLIEHLGSVAPTGGTVKHISTLPYRVRLLMEASGIREQVDITHNAAYRWKGPKSVASEVVARWLREASL